jgi:hypothetical protein
MYMYCRTLKSLAKFAQKRAERSPIRRTLRKHKDAEELKKWEAELKRAYERFTVSGECSFLLHAG